MTCHTRTTDAIGTISGQRKQERSQLFPGILELSANAIQSDSTTDRGTAIPEKIAVFLAARRNAALLNSFM